MNKKRSIGITVSGWGLIVIGGYAVLVALLEFPSTAQDILGVLDGGRPATVLIHYLNSFFLFFAGIQLLKLKEPGRLLVLALSLIWIFYYGADFCFYKEISLLGFLRFVGDIVVPAAYLIFFTHPKVMAQFGHE